MAAHILPRAGRGGGQGGALRRLLLVAAALVAAALVAGLVTAVVVLSTQQGSISAAHEAPALLQGCLGGVDQQADPADCLVGRDVWLAAPSKPVSRLRTPVNLVVVHHTGTEPCRSRAKCVELIRDLQQLHMAAPRNWSDIAFNFLVGGDGLVYLGRGWDTVGSHTLRWNNKSIGVAAIGTFTAATAPAALQRALHQLLDWGVSLGKLAADYGVLGACQVRPTDSPGERFMQDVRASPRWTNVSSGDGTC
ncbi:Peptidoglycan-recognition protein LE [Frankliniella fusca]|uniref:Peptidoglycan-recognition protein LE n=1 Tax=Frankliniella fusca TaxID=407009 RepID=A0AAE1LC98_9NEOP|nr:Peptidoglycan-recognition protein LE [Frankliniella fusca]